MEPIRRAAQSSVFGRVLAFAILAITLGATLGGWLLAKNRVEESAELRFSSEVAQVHNAITVRMDAYAQVLRGGQALWKASEVVTRAEWRDYVETLALPQGYPGIQGVGFSVLLAPDELDAHEAAVRAEGFPSYNVYPEGPREVYSAIVYLEPFDTRNQRAFGFDMFQEPTRQAAMSRARDTGEPALSGRVRLVQENETDVQSGFLLYLPVYREDAPLATPEERRAALVGWVYSPFRAADLMRGILGEGTPDVGFELFDGARMEESSLLYDSDDTLHLDPAAPPPARAIVETIEVGGRTWTVRYETTPSFEAATASALPTAVGLGGLASSLLLFGVVYGLATTRARAERLAERMTENLRRSEAEKSRLAEQLARSNEDLQQFAYVASHDLQEPLRMVSGYLSLIERRYKGRLDKDADEFIGFAVDGSKRMNRLILDLLDYARVETQGKALEPTSAQKALDAAMENLNASIRDSQASVTSDPLPTLPADPSQLERLFQNLVGNAIKYRRPGIPIRIHVGAAREGAEWRFSVKDNGIGIDPKHVPRLFVMFSRLHTRDAYPGSGMGLAICKRIVQRHGGRIWVESRPGEGAEFLFTLPAGEEVAP